MSHGIKLVYISTDYVFNGEKGDYRENDPVFPVNKYAWSKLGGECCVRLYDNSVVLRLSFGPNEFPYEAAFTDQWTSRESAAAAANKIREIIDTDILGTLHIGTKKQSVYDFARSLNPTKDLKTLSREDVPFSVPRDTSLNTSKYDGLIRKKKEGT